MEKEYELWHLRYKVNQLEKQVEHLRISRRVLMNLIERLEKEKRNQMLTLEKENKRLHSSNKRYAKWLMKYNCRLVEMQTKDDLIQKYYANEKEVEE